MRVEHVTWDQLVAEQSTDLVAVTDERGTIRYASPSFQTVLGYDPRRVTAHEVFAHVHPDDVAEARAQFGEAWRHGTGQAVFRLRHADGTWRWLSARGSYMDDRAHPAVIFVGQDITDRKRLEADLLQAQRLTTIGHLASCLMHDVNNMLTGIASFAELGRYALPPEHPVQADLYEIINAAARATSFARTTLAFARKRAVAPRLIDLNKLLSALERLIHVLLGPGIQLRLRVDPDLSKIRADPGQLEQVIINLAVNARDAMPNGGVLTIAIANVTREDQDERPGAGGKARRYVRLTVQDTGEGIDEATRAHLFEPFFTTKVPWHGTGLGLSWCRTILAQYGGDMAITSEVGNGTTVSVYLPHVTQTQIEET
jgi:PAS domain S-box-containing protein